MSFETPQNPVVAIPCRFDPDQRHHNKKRQVFACLFLLWYRLRGGVRGIHLTHCFYKTLNAVVRQFACKFLPRVPVYGIRQSPKGTDRHHIIFGYNGNRYFPEQVKTCLFLLWCRLRGGVRGNSLAVAYQFACKFLPRVPVCGIRQSPKGTDQHHIIFGYNGNRYFSEQVFTCLFLLWYQLRGDVRGNSLAAAFQFACKFLPRVPVYGIRQTPAATDKCYTIFEYGHN